MKFHKSHLCRTDISCSLAVLNCTLKQSSVEHFENKQYWQNAEKRYWHSEHPIFFVFLNIRSYFTDSKSICSREECTYHTFSMAIEKRNYRERNRVKAINSAFQELRSAIPTISQRNKRTSKVRILMKAIQYIRELEDSLYYECHTTNI